MRRVGALLGILLVLAFPTLANAHARLVSSSPAANARVSAPTALRLTFNERVELRFTALTLLGADGRAMAVGALTREGDGREIHAPITGALPADTYTVQWKTAGADGHAMTGSFRFTVVGDSARPPGRDSVLATHVDSTSTQPVPIAFFSPSTISGRAARGVELILLLVVIGVVAFRFLVLPSTAWGAADVADASDRARRLGLSCALILGAFTLARLWGVSTSLSDSSATPASHWEIVTTTTWGRGWLVGAIGIALAIVAFRLARSHARWWPLAAVGALLAAAQPALTGHGTMAGVLGVVVDVLHVIAVGSWLGGLTVLVVAGMPAILPERSVEGLSALVRSFHRVALVGGGLTVVTGLINSGLRLHWTLAELTASSYGKVLTSKVVLAGVILSLGFYHSRKATAQWSPSTARSFRASAMMEIGVAAVVVVLTAILVSTELP